MTVLALDKVIEVATVWIFSTRAIEVPRSALWAQTEAAMIFKAPAQFGQWSMSISRANGRGESSRKKAMGEREQARVVKPNWMIVDVQFIVEGSGLKYATQGKVPVSNFLSSLTAAA
jgi:hypothetical protein